ncbi:hypothetical protein EON63_08230 [archaeon]|nr:MAG: hypothetical protein EON63_08230 [archaeon]
MLHQCFSNLTGELQGEYHELGKLTPEQTQFLLDKGYLFQIPSARNLLTGAGAARNWPDNRGVYGVWNVCMVGNVFGVLVVGMMCV